MVHGCPVASSNATCIPEVLGDAAHYFDPESVEDMAAKIDEVITNKHLSDSLVEKGYKQAKKFSWERMTEQTLAVYNEILS
jgi:glycosyltransferase involved in cell wall biosynthesis